MGESIRLQWLSVFVLPIIICCHLHIDQNQLKDRCCIAEKKLPTHEQRQWWLGPLTTHKQQLTHPQPLIWQHPPLHPLLRWFVPDIWLSLNTVSRLQCCCGSTCFCTRQTRSRVVAVTFSPWTRRIVQDVHAKHIGAINSPGISCARTYTLRFTALHVWPRCPTSS